MNDDNADKINNTEAQYIASLQAELAKKDAEIKMLSARMKKFEEHEIEAEEERRAMIYMLEDVNESTAKLEMAKKEWEATFNAISDLIFIHDTQFRIIRANSAYLEAAGASFEEIEGKLYYTVFPKMDGPLELCQNVLESRLDGDLIFRPSETEISLSSINKIFKVRHYDVRKESGKILYSVHIVADITNARKASERLKEEMETTTALLKITEATAYTIDVDKLMEQVVNAGGKIVKCSICLSYLWDDETKTFQPNQCHGLPHELIPLFRTHSLDVKTGFVREALEKKQPVIISDFGLRNVELKSGISNSISQTKDSATQNIHAEVFQWMNDINTMIIIPLAAKQDYLGVIIGIGRRGDAVQYVSAKFTERDINIFNAISSQVSVALEQARLYRESFERAIELSHKIETIKVMNEIDRSILSTVDSQTVIETVTRLVGSVIPCDRATIALVDKERQGLTYAAGFGTSSLAKGGFIAYEDTSATEVIKKGYPQYDANLASLKNLLPLEKRLLDEGFLSHIRIPLIVKGETVGVLNIGAKRASAFIPENISTMEKLAAQIGVALENARLFADIEELFLGTVKSLSSAIDAKSRWTAGHSERVTKYSVTLGKELCLSPKELKHLELAAILHDIGKIGTYEAILDKPGRLTDEEIQLARQHPVKGAKILAPIKQLKEVLTTVRHHHESYDGTGYPDGLKGETIPLFARIIGVADAVDAMSEDRPYRKGRPLNEIINELKRCSGIQFDPKITGIFLKALQKEK